MENNGLRLPDDLLNGNSKDGTTSVASENINSSLPSMDDKGETTSGLQPIFDENGKIIAGVSSINILSKSEKPDIQKEILSRIDGDGIAQADTSYHNPLFGKQSLRIWPSYMSDDGDIISDSPPENKLYDETYAGFFRNNDGSYYLLSRDEGTHEYRLRECVPDQKSDGTFEFYIFGEEQDWQKSTSGQGIMTSLSNNNGLLDEGNIWIPQDNVNVFRCASESMFREIKAVSEHCNGKPLKDAVKADVTAAKVGTQRR